MEVCEVCGAFLIVGDAQQRIDDHLMGKQHMGYARLKSAVEEVSASLRAVKEERIYGRGGMGGAGLASGFERERDRGERDRRRDREREREREKERERELRRYDNIVDSFILNLLPLKISTSFNLTGCFFQGKGAISR